MLASVYIHWQVKESDIRPWQPTFLLSISQHTRSAHGDTQAMIQKRLDKLREIGVTIRRRKQIESRGHEFRRKAPEKVFYCATLLFCSAPPQLERALLTHQSGQKNVQSYCLCVKNWSVDNIVQLWINYVNVKVCQNSESRKIAVRS